MRVSIPFTNFPASWQPNGLQLEAAANLIKTLDLAPHGQHGVLLPDFTTNPVLEVLVSFFFCFFSQGFEVLTLTWDFF